MLTITKFGGSSLSSETQFKKVKKIIEEDPRRRVVVVSALGKRLNEDNKMTDLLYLIAAHIKHGVAYDALWQTIVERFLSVKKELNLQYDILSDLIQLKNELNQAPINVDYLVSRGEYFTAKLMSEYLGFAFIDAKDVILFHHNGQIDLNRSQERLQQYLQPNFTFVIPGFYGAYPNGKIKLLTRGGSDITGAIIANCLRAQTYENWTDVSGILVADPRIITNPVSISHLTYEELSELSYMGANVLHEETIYPIRELNIPIHIKNTNDPQAKGTIICDHYSENNQQITGISGKKDFISITIYKNHMSTEVGFLHRAMAIFERYHLNVEHVPTGIDHVGIIISAHEVETCLFDLISTLKSELQADDITIKENIALITVVGREVIGNANLSSAIFRALGKRNVKISLIAQSPREINIVIGVQNEDYLTTIEGLYEELITA